jgi:hypothetical protein
LKKDRNLPKVHDDLVALMKHYNNAVLGDMRYAVWHGVVIGAYTVEKSHREGMESKLSPAEFRKGVVECLEARAKKMNAYLARLKQVKLLLREQGAR